MARERSARDLCATSQIHLLQTQRVSQHSLHSQAGKSLLGSVRANTMSQTLAPIDQETFSAAQAAEFGNWQSRVADPDHIRHELDEHSEIEHPLRTICGNEGFERGLEVGIGPYGLGFLAVHFKDRVRTIDGIDPLPRLDIRLADESLQARIDAIRRSVRYVQAQAEAIPAESASYDIVSCINVVDHAQNPDRILKEIARVLRPGGLLVFGVSTLSAVGERMWHYRRTKTPSAWLFVAHPHTFQWTAASHLVGLVRGVTLWNDQPCLFRRIAGHGRMSFWIRRKNPS